MEEYITLLEYLIQTNKCYFDEHSNRRVTGKQEIVTQSDSGERHT